MKLFFQIYLTFLFAMQSVYASRICLPPNLNDPDEFMDNIGKTNFCNREDLGGGNTSSPIGAGDDGARSVVVAPGGILYLAGRTYNGSNNDFGIIKYFPDGSLDTSFDTDGKLSITFGNGDDTAHAILVQTDSKLIVIGRSDRGTPDYYDYAVARILTSGALDTSFKTNGKAFIDILGLADIPRSGIIDSSGRILLGGYTNWEKYYPSFGRLNTDGSLDTTFNSRGWTAFPIGTTDAGIMSIELDSLGRVIAGGNYYNGANWDFASVRLTSAGSLDTSFATKGFLTLSVGTSAESAYAVISNNANQIILAGSSTNASPNLDFALVRLDTNGTLDTAFFTTGKRAYALGAGDEGFNALGIETNGNTLIGAGYYFNGTDNDFAALRFRSNGTLDTSFNTTGRITKAIRTGEDTAQSMYTKMQGLIYLAGRTYNGSNIDYAVLRLQSDGSLARSGQPAKSFSNYGQLEFDFNADDLVRVLLPESSGNMIMAGASDAGGGVEWSMVRLKMDASFDTAFNTNGKRSIDFGGGDSIVGGGIQTDGKFLMVGAGDPDDNIRLARFNTDASFDTAFSTVGSVIMTTGDELTAIVMQTNGRLLIIGNANGQNDFVVFRYNTDGSLDTSFNTGAGRLVIDSGGVDQSYWGFVQGDEKIVLSGAGGNQTRLARLLSSGVLDTTFATSGFYGATLTTSGTDLVGAGGAARADSNNRIITRFFADDGSGSGETAAYLARFESNGTLDTSFSTRGLFRYRDTQSGESGALIRLGGGKYQAVDNISFGFDSISTRILSNGTLDTTFATSGVIALNTSGNYNAAETLNGMLCGVGTDLSRMNYFIGCYWQ